MRKRGMSLSKKKLKARIKELEGQVITMHIINSATACAYAVTIQLIKAQKISEMANKGGIVCGTGNDQEA